MDGADTRGPLPKRSPKKKKSKNYNGQRERNRKAEHRDRKERRAAELDSQRHKQAWERAMADRGRRVLVHGEYFIVSDHAIERYRERCAPDLTDLGALNELLDCLREEARVTTTIPPGYPAQHTRNTDRFLVIDSKTILLPCKTSHRSETGFRCWGIRTVLSKQTPGGEDATFCLPGSGEFSGVPIRIPDHPVRRYRKKIKITGSLEATRTRMIAQLTSHANQTTKKPEWVQQRKKGVLGYLLLTEAHQRLALPILPDNQDPDGLMVGTTLSKYVVIEKRVPRDKRKRRPNRLDALAELTG